jgi:hypothetical protein
MTRHLPAYPLLLLLAVPVACGDVRMPPGPGGGAGNGAQGGAAPGGGSGTGGAAGASGAPGGGSGGATGTAGSAGGRDAAPPADSAAARDAAPLVSVPGPVPATMQMFNSPCLSTPDPDVAAGPTLVGTAIQWNAYFFKKDSGMLDHMYKWTALQGRLVSDTHIVFDSTSRRWYITTIVGLAGGNFGVQIMVSTDENATAWAASVPATKTSLIDDPMPTITSDKVVITEHGPCIWVLDKGLLQAGNAPVVPPTTCATRQNNQIYAVKYGLQVPTTAYGITGVDSSTLNWIAVDGTPAANDVRVTEHQVKVATYSEVPVFGGLRQNNLDLESPGVKAMWDQGHLVWTKTLRCPAGMTGCTVMRLFDVDTAANTIRSTDYTLPSTQLFNGAAGIDKLGNVWILAGQAVTTGSVGLALMGHTATGMNYAPSIIVPGGAALSGNRYGDYAAAAQDPVDGSLWFINEYAETTRAAALNSENSVGACKVVHLTAREGAP